MNNAYTMFWELNKSYKLSVTETAIMLRVIHICTTENHNQVQLSAPELAKCLSTQRQTIMVHMDRLVDRGLLNAEKKLGQATIYTLKLDATSIKNELVTSTKNELVVGEPVQKTNWSDESYPQPVQKTNWSENESYSQPVQKTNWLPPTSTKNELVTSTKNELVVAPYSSSSSSLNNISSSTTISIEKKNVVDEIRKTEVGLAVWNSGFLNDITKQVGSRRRARALVYRFIQRQHRKEYSDSSAITTHFLNHIDKVPQQQILIATENYDREAWKRLSDSMIQAGHSIFSNLKYVSSNDKEIVIAGLSATIDELESNDEIILQLKKLKSYELGNCKIQYKTK